MGAPISTTYTPAERLAIIEHVLAGVAAGRAVDTILKTDDGMPSSATWWRWHMNDPDLESSLVRARELGVEARLEKAAQIADGDDIDFEADGTTAEGRAKMRANVKRATLRVNTYIKLAQMLKPKKYGPKLDLTSGGDKLGDGAPDASKEARALELMKIVEHVEQRALSDRAKSLLE